MRGRLQCYMWVGMDRIVNIGDSSSKSTFGAYKLCKNVMLLHLILLSGTTFTKIMEDLVDRVTSKGLWAMSLLRCLAPGQPAQDETKRRRSGKACTCAWLLQVVLGLPIDLTWLDCPHTDSFFQKITFCLGKRPQPPVNKKMVNCGNHQAKTCAACPQVAKHTI